MRGTATSAIRRSEGYEFAELREYDAGDDPRRIDWAASARAGALQTRVMIEDRSLTLAAALDASASMFAGGNPPNYNRAMHAAELWYAMATDEDCCARATAAGPLFPRSLPGRVAAHVCTAEPEEPGANFAQALATALAALPRDAHLLIVSDFFDVAALERTLRACAARFDAVALLAGDPWDGALPLGGFVRLRDAESGTVARVFVGARERARYREAVETRERTVLATLRRFGLRAARLGSAGPASALFEALRSDAMRAA
ncbi:MAG: DUF58 domain-containing protein [Candidatus Eremiobacteraeota bacterium]|nr:DUF58 domain-containing protein [Candidatus Eremiobacteraeota bacterium]